MKKILLFAVLLAFLSNAIAFPASQPEAQYSSSGTSANAGMKENGSIFGASDYFKLPDPEDEADTISKPQMDKGERDSRRQRARGEDVDTSRYDDRQEQSADEISSDDTYDNSYDNSFDNSYDSSYDNSSDSSSDRSYDSSYEKRYEKPYNVNDGEALKEDKEPKKDKDGKELNEEKKRSDIKTGKERVKRSKVARKTRPGQRKAKELSTLERAMSENPVTADKAKPEPYGNKQLIQFGYNFFKSKEDPFASQTDVPVGPDYIIGAGDRLILTVWGSLNGTYKLDVSRSGDIVIPKVGAVKVGGQSYGQLPALLKNHIARIYKDFELNVNMGQLRLVKVYVVGEVASPGDYNISSLSTLIGALSEAGGPTKNGSLRNIQINRNGKLLETVDLYDFFLKGDKGKDIRLQPGDTVLVPVIGKVAGVAGNVRRPGIYELKGQTTLKDLLALAGGINSIGYLQRVQLYRVQAHDKKVVTDVNLDVIGKTSEDITAAVPVQDLDLVKVLSIDRVLRGYVRLEGHVVRPGDYALKPGMKISSLVQKDSLLPEYHAATGQIIRLFAPDLHPEVVPFDVSRAMAGEAGQDLELKEFDRVKIFSKREMEEVPVVKVSGEVKRPGPVRYMENMTVRDLLTQAGNVKLSAYLKNAEITRIKRTGDAVTSFTITVDLEKAMAGGEANIKLSPFDELTVRRIPNWAEAKERYVTLKGEFVFPGTYPISKGERLSSVIARAGGFTDRAYLKGTRFTRESARKLQQQRMDESLAKAQENIIKLQTNMSQTASSAEEVASSKTTLEGLMQSVEILKQKKAEGRVLIEIASLKELEGSNYDVELQGGDKLSIPSDPGGINVIGDVYNQNTIVAQKGRSVEWYLKQVGGATADADTDGIYVVKVDGSVTSQANSTKFLFYNSFWGKPLDSGDTIIVPRQYEKTAYLRNMKDIATIIGNIAVMAGVLVAAGL
ncbi:periplasmic polysaccharide biosynthesis/export protein [Citrifermentans bemidjiense Bem]|uniref:Periplasmic polysaccharide biosynthesis/export protein n=1 Tax=Citrifermentans bemidjiense (strain ATCC BAA-1014 / DSM 16622 / JCM 12645 / Bem) TaxID=404380 RepID=B5E8N7_CITBB|nr:SLBB domain-containing protein [Citrifermentans bemidjiense]ACH38622.1 periplasmic polysaccharide biosynthesis/export protein [Citrifermentans bemidjiense Bem]